MQRKRINGMLAGLLAVGGAFLSALILGWSRETGYQLIWVGLTILAGWGALRLMEEKDGSARVCFGVLGLLFMLAMGLGYRLETADETGWDGLALCVGLALCWGPAAGAAFLALCRRLERAVPGQEIHARRVFWISFAVILLCWLPVQLAYFPCCFGYDLNGQIGQVNSGEFNTHHPLFHTLLVGGFYVLGGKLGSYTLGAWMYAIFQMICLAASMAYALTYLAQLRCPKWLRMGLTVFFALAPTHSVMSIGCTKDVPFAAVMTVAAVEMHKLLREPSRIRDWRKALRLVLILAGLCLFRNNASMAVAAFAIAGIILIGRGSRMRMLALVAAALALNSGLSFAMKTATNAEPGAINEMLSVPAQQLARIYDKYGYDEPTSYEVVEWVPHADMYDPARADFTKQHLTVRREGELAGFIKFWVREFFRFPIEYIDAFLLNAKGYWFPDDKSFATIYGEWPEAYVGALITEQYPIRVEFTSYLPRLRALYEHLFVQNHYQSVPGLSTLIHPATYTWMLLTAMAWAVWRRRWAVLGTAFLLLTYLLTLLLGPCTLIRYCYYLMISAPFLIGLLASPGEREKR